MKLSSSSIMLAIENIKIENDTDLFPSLKEFEIIYNNKTEIVNYLTNIDIGYYNWLDSRRFIIPKSENSYRTATQLNIIDSIMFSSLMFEFGSYIENHRIPIEDEKVFNYRFSPSKEGYLYSKNIGWETFWNSSRNKIEKYNYAVYLDISDFYNQISHHTIEQQLQYSGIPDEVVKSIITFLGKLTKKISRGIPIGPHSVHLLAELSLIPVDNSLLTRGFDFCRFSDDIIIFTSTYEDAKLAIYYLAEILDKQQKLILQQQKTKIFEKDIFIDHCEHMVENKMTSGLESKMISIINKHSSSPYEKIKITKLLPSEIDVYSTSNIESVIQEIISQSEIDYMKLRWFIRRLTQIGSGGAVLICLQNLNIMLPAINDIMLYLLSVANNKSNMHDEGNVLVDLLSNKIISSNEFFQIAILNLFTSSNKFDHINKIVNIYKTSSENIRREIILSAYKAGACDWIRELKEDFNTMGCWCQRAYIIACSILPKDEKDIYLRKNIKLLYNATDFLENQLIAWSVAQ